MQNEEIINIPHNFTLRDYQKPAWNYYANGGKRGVLIWHRRAGKDLLSFNIMIAQTLNRIGNYWHILPFYNQARKSIWEARTKEGQSYIECIPPQLINKKRNDEMAIELHNGSIIRLVGGDKPDSLVGAAPVGAVISEWALQRPSLWHYLEPMLLENDGWVLFNTTPRGENHAKQTYENYSKNYFASLLTIEDTNIITEEQINEIRRNGTPEEIIQQEYYCSFEGAIYGSYYGDVIKNLNKKKQICSVPYDTQSMVHTFWDLGIDDCTAIWFIQFVGREIRVIDYYENNNKGIMHYVDMLKNVKDYTYGAHYLPHDADSRELGSGTSIKEQLKTMGLQNIKIVPRTANIYNDIQKARSILPMCWFDADKTHDGLEALKQYRREFNEDKKTFMSTPLHDWSSHGADAFRMFAQSYKANMENVIRQPTQANIGSAWNTKWNIKTAKF